MHWGEKEKDVDGNHSHDIWEMKLNVFLNPCLLELPTNVFVSKSFKHFNLFILL